MKSGSSQGQRVFRLTATGSRGAPHALWPIATFTSERLARVSGRRPQRDKLPMHDRPGRAPPTAGQEPFAKCV